MDETTKVAIIGAGPAGLAVAACLRQAGVDFVMLEKEQQAAPAWRRHYDRVHLHTTKRYSSLPFVPFPKDYPRYVPRHLVVEYLDAYAKRFDLEPRFSETVRAITREGRGWRVESTSGALRAWHVVIASGYNAEPLLPKFAGIDAFKGKTLHSADYRNATPFAGQSVLVVGMGNTGAEIALDLAEGGARPTISVRDGVHIVPRELFGVPIQMVGMATRLGPRRINDALFPLILDLVLGRLEKFGLRRPKQGLLQQIALASRIPVIDVGTIGKIREGAIKVAPDIAEISERGARFVDGGHGEFDAILFATGYRPGYAKFLDPGIQPDRSGVTAQASDLGLYLVGFHNAVTGLLREIGIEAQSIADDIRHRLNRKKVAEFLPV
ncbi:MULTISPECIES: NAD(P)/FAD-dependent oxidoreductase [unclassified Mesorhizobium]|uniref:flavin-containing monooxygenase n=1 Tax=unclassified Mesorhizobium TaxID=325217 RepID=UPI000FDB7DC5|nr:MULTISPECIES: NAD(P)/FAD-dependent oxidoreductase [unclassified Mesorhizobium]TGR58655.1 NAD(P)/FAD-dependent oxidoreductase [bacterium M00.F.Ca.ET.199.01.1.1]TGU41236.1 NAD(P)/FAD-dependent oxidoreductase [bacterium M00.F.Ca.ET.156.01.1.1]TGV90520.1 NAD(P)/FAD-dependent oxidoreductase [Mesorhizobium sp. M00.F.Ca.ET.149.01.1.1]TGR33405.1 NAD(P)/FAD-dependent oxidoreductase [Mesorhizobium sp. M8A.F.Ca.ET.197.01.1.1]TGR35042.1 NAD(P)/FAD-dependent oxidoreductase [Mesorhizobium sp. M8A.F.Ca.ET